MVLVKLRVPDRQDRTQGLSKHGLRDATEQRVRQTPSTMSPHHNQTHIGGHGCAEDRISRQPAGDDEIRHQPSRSQSLS